MITTTIVTPTDDLARLVSEINSAEWDEANEMSVYDVESLAAYLHRQDTLFVTCHEVTGESATLLGFASSRFELKPYAREKWLYVDEMDVCANKRQQGVGKLIMKTLLEQAEKADCEEVWLGTEAGNHPANALYQSLDPDDVAQVVGYTYELDE
ncbi:MAG: GNAT family N-acetyltransferase [Pseudomonadales bacterium]